MTGPQIKFCEGVVVGMTGTDAYLAAYPKSGKEAAAVGASRLLGNAKIVEHIRVLRLKAEEKAGSAVLTLAEKRTYIARLVRAKIAELPHDSDLYCAIESTEFGYKYKLPDKLKAIELDNDLGGEGSEAEANDALAGLLERVMK